ncbi:MAG: PD40 domain-containing protein [candidate division Zixibacteria bacterium]|nr:PD40 domain-containing protein [candidate division Zixibacteria bacterium]
MKLSSRAVLTLFVGTSLLASCGDKKASGPVDGGTDSSSQIRYVGPGYDASWSPDGTKIASNEGDHILILSLVDSSVTMLTIPPDNIPPSHDWWDEEPSWSPDGHWILFSGKARDWPASDEDADLWRYPATGGKPERVTSNLLGTETQPHWSPDGRWIAYYEFSYPIGDDYREVIAIMPAEGGDPRVLAVDQAGSAFRMSWSPDGQWIAYASRGEGLYDQFLRVRSVSDTSITRIVTRATADTMICEDCTWSPDGQTIAFVQLSLRAPYNKTIWTVPASGGTPQPLYLGSDQLPCCFDGPSYSPDGSHLALTHGGIIVVPSAGL